MECVKKEIIKEFIRNRFRDKFIDVVFLEINDDAIEEYFFYPADYLDHDNEVEQCMGYIIMTEGITIPFIVEILRDCKFYVYLNPEKDFYLGLLEGQLDCDEEMTIKIIDSFFMNSGGKE